MKTHVISGGMHPRIEREKRGTRTVAEEEQEKELMNPAGKRAVGQRSKGLIGTRKPNHRTYHLGRGRKARKTYLRGPRKEGEKEEEE